MSDEDLRAESEKLVCTVNEVLKLFELVKSRNPPHNSVLQLSQR